MSLVGELCTTAFLPLYPLTLVPQSLRSQLSCQPCSYVLASKERQLVYNGTLKLLDSSKHSRDMVAFLFTDSLLLTQQSSQTDKKVAKKEVGVIT